MGEVPRARWMFSVFSINLWLALDLLFDVHENDWGSTLPLTKKRFAALLFSPRGNASYYPRKYDNQRVNIFHTALKILVNGWKAA